MRIVAALASVRHRVDVNPEKCLKRLLRERIHALCDEIDHLLSEWANSQSQLLFEDSFHIQQIAAKYLPDAIDRFSSIPKSFATTKLLDNGKTALQVFEETLDNLSGKVAEIKDALALQEAQSLINHATFVNQKFNPAKR
jgi:hypothetical protein